MAQVNEPQLSINLTYYYPVIKYGDYFIEAPESELMGSSRPIFPDLENYLENHYKPVRTNVELNGKFYLTDVFVPRFEGDVAYVLANSERVPQQDYSSNITLSHQDIEAIQAEIDAYLQTLYDIVSYSEGIYPTQISYINTGFIFPTFTEVDESGYNSLAKYSWEEILRQPRAVILGEPGAGKTTCLKRMALDIASRSRTDKTRKTIPIYIQLRDWSKNFDIIHNIKNYLNSLKFSLLAESLEIFSEMGQILVILDGLDELPITSRYNIVKSIESTITIYPLISIIISTRKDGFRWNLPGFRYLEIEQFSYAQIKEYIYQKTQINNKQNWQNLYSHLRSKPEILQIAKNPLTLSLVIYLYTQNSILPTNRSLLLRSFIEVIINLWDSVRGITRIKEQWANPSAKLFSLCRAAFLLRLSGKSTFSLEDFVSWEKGFVTEDDPKEMLLAIVQHTGLIRYNQDNKLSFAHETICDYLAARYLVERTEDTGKFLEENLHNARWQKVWQYACGITPDASHLINLAIESTALDNVSKSILLTEALTQKIIIKQSTLFKGCKVIVSTLEENSKAMDLQSNHSNTNTEKELWFLTLDGNKDNHPNKVEKLQKLRILLRAIYNSRDGIAQDRLSYSLKQSNVKPVSDFADCLRIDGHYQDKVTEVNKDISINIAIEDVLPSN